MNHTGFQPRERTGHNRLHTARFHYKNSRIGKLVYVDRKQVSGGQERAGIDRKGAPGNYVG